MGFSRVLSATLLGMEVRFVQVEADLSSGLPMFHMVGYLSSEVKEAGERVRTAIRNSGIEIPAKKTVINLSPAYIRKKGASFDLPIALAILTAAELLDADLIKDMLVIGELGLDGSIRGCKGVLPIISEAKKTGYKICVVPEENAKEAALVQDMHVVAASSLEVLCGYFKDRHFPRFENMYRESKEEKKVDFIDVCGQDMAKRAAEIAVAGNHNLLLMGPPGSGKSMIAKRIPTILPSLSMEESIEITKVYSVAGLLSNECPLVRERPFREVHHTVSKAALMGGGAIPKPGEMSLASGGVLFLDELAEFKRGVLESLRQPMESRDINLVRNSGNYKFPADVMVVAATNPCPCGEYPDYNKCHCTPYQIQQYIGKISQPFLGRIDICIEVPKVEYKDLQREQTGESSDRIRKRVQSARSIQEKRYQGKGFTSNASIPSSEVDYYCKLGVEEERLMKQAFAQLDLTARTYHKILKVARTIADLDGKEQVEKAHLCEAIGYRMLDKKYWG